MIPSSVEILLALSVALADLRENLGFGQPLSRQIEVEQLGDVTRAQERHLAAGLKFHLRAEKQGEAGETDVMVPTLPHPHLVLGHAELTLCFVEGVFDPEALSLHPGVALPVPFVG